MIASSSALNHPFGDSRMAHTFPRAFSGTADGTMKTHDFGNDFSAQGELRVVNLGTDPLYFRWDGNDAAIAGDDCLVCPGGSAREHTAQAITTADGDTGVEIRIIGASGDYTVELTRADNR